MILQIMSGPGLKEGWGGVYEYYYCKIREKGISLSILKSGMIIYTINDVQTHGTNIIK